jgi:hypothetical protein
MFAPRQFQLSPTHCCLFIDQGLVVRIIEAYFISFLGKVIRSVLLLTIHDCTHWILNTRHPSLFLACSGNYCNSFNRKSFVQKFAKTWHLSTTSRLWGLILR